MKSQKDRKPVRSELCLSVITANSTLQTLRGLRAGHQEARRSALLFLLPLCLSGDMSVIRFETLILETQVWMMGVNVTRKIGMRKRGKKEGRGIKNRDYVTQNRRTERSFENSFCKNCFKNSAKIFKLCNFFSDYIYLKKHCKELRY